MNLYLVTTKVGGVVMYHGPLLKRALFYTEDGRGEFYDVCVIDATPLDALALKHYPQDLPPEDVNA